MVEFREILQKWKIRNVLQSSSAESGAVGSTAMDMVLIMQIVIACNKFSLLFQSEGLLPVKSDFIH